jgi:hypothetical protein
MNRRASPLLSAPLPQNLLPRRVADALGDCFDGVLLAFVHVAEGTVEGY